MHGVSLVTTPRSSKPLYAPSEKAVKFKCNLLFEKTSEFILNMDEYLYGKIEKDRSGERIIGGRVNKGNTVNFTLFLDFDKENEFHLFVYQSSAMWYKEKKTSEQFKYVPYQTSTTITYGAMQPLFLVYEDDAKGTIEKKLKRYLVKGLLPAKYTAESSLLKGLPRVMLIYHQQTEIR